MKLRKFFAAIVLLACGSANAAITYDVTSQFDLVNNPSSLGPWSYGQLSSASGGSFTLFSQHNLPSSPLTGWESSSPDGYPDVSVNLSGQNQLAGNGFAPQGAVTLSAGMANGVLGVVRWTAPQSGLYHLSGVFTGVYANGEGTNAEAYLIVNASVAASQALLQQGSDTFADDINLSAGNTVDFGLDWGPDKDGGFDRAVLNATITSVPEPTSITLLGAGGLLMLRRRRRVA